MSLFPENDKARKMLVLFKYLTRYFPKAHREVTKVCVVNNVRYSPDREPNDITWARGKSTDQLGSAFRHMAEYAVDGKVFEDVPADIVKTTGIDKVYTLAEAMWRIGAQLELEIEKQEGNSGTTPTGPESGYGTEFPGWLERVSESAPDVFDLRTAPPRPYTYAGGAPPVPRCPVCCSSEFVVLSSTGYGWSCSNSHPTHHFFARDVGV